MADPADLTAEARDYCQILTEAAEGYPSDIWPDPPEAERPKDAAAAWLLRKMACPIYRESRDLIARLADALDAERDARAATRAYVAHLHKHESDLVDKLHAANRRAGDAEEERDHMRRTWRSPVEPDAPDAAIAGPTRPERNDMANDPVNALTAACPECGHQATDHVGGGPNRFSLCVACDCHLLWLDIWRRLADPTWPDRGGDPPAVLVGGDGSLWTGDGDTTEAEAHFEDDGSMVVDALKVRVLPVVASDEEDRRG